MDRIEYPKMLYGSAGWDDLGDCRIVVDPDEEKSARSDGYKPLEECVDDLKKGKA